MNIVYTIPFFIPRKLLDVWLQNSTISQARGRMIFAKQFEKTAGLQIMGQKSRKTPFLEM